MLKIGLPLVSIFLLFMVGVVEAQTSLGVNTNSPNSNAVLHLVSPSGNQGLLIPTLSTSQRLGMDLGAIDNGLMVYDLSETQFYFWNGSEWSTFVQSSDADPENELQSLLFNSNQLTLSDDPGSVVVDFSGWDMDASDDFDGDYTSLVNKPTIPTNTSELTNDSGFITSADDADSDSSNELQGLNFNSNQLTLSDDPGSVVVDFSGWDMDSSDDFDGDYTSLSSLPTLGTLAALNTVGTTEISDGSVTSDKLADVVTANTYTIVIGGDITYNSKGQIIATGTSDQRLKKDTVRIQNALSRLKGVKGYTYFWKDESLPLIQHGFMAQQLEAYFPDLVRTNVSGMKSVNYTGMIPVLVEALKEQQQEIEQLRNELEEKDHSISSIESKLNKLEAALSLMENQIKTVNQ